MKPADEKRHARQDSTLSRSAIWTDQTAAWYRRAAERGDYAARVLEAIGPRLGSCRTALDVGAGCGALAIPLARRPLSVTALEPSPAMARELRRWTAIALSIIREEHRSLSAVTRSLRVLAQDARNLDSALDYQPFTLILDYIEGFSGRFHHPKEEAYLFSALRRRCAEAIDALDGLERDHAQRLFRLIVNMALAPTGAGPSPGTGPAP